MKPTHPVKAKSTNQLRNFLPELLCFLLLLNASSLQVVHTEAEDLNDEVHA